MAGCWVTSAKAIDKAINFHSSNFFSPGSPAIIPPTTSDLLPSYDPLLRPRHDAHHIQWTMLTRSRRRKHLVPNAQIPRVQSLSNFMGNWSPRFNLRQVDRLGRNSRLCDWFRRSSSLLVDRRTLQEVHHWTRS